MEDRLVYSVEEAAKLLGISRSFAYKAVHRGVVPKLMMEAQDLRKRLGDSK